MDTQACPRCTHTLAPFAHKCTQCGYSSESEVPRVVRRKATVVEKEEDFMSFRWWTLWSVVHLIGATLTFFFAMKHEWYYLAAAMGVIFVLSMYSMKLNRHAFIALTVLTLDPIQCWINYKYVKPRWNRPELDNGL
ncbi:MAG: hypothetical protein ACK5NC_01405 [Vibrio sp.]